AGRARDADRVRGEEGLDAEITGREGLGATPAAARPARVLVERGARPCALAAGSGADARPEGVRRPRAGRAEARALAVVGVLVDPVKPAAGEGERGRLGLAQLDLHLLVLQLSVERQPAVGKLRRVQRPRGGPAAQRQRLLAGGPGAGAVDRA